MSLVAAKCTNCGGTLQVDATKEAAVCQYCGAAFIVEKAIQNYNIHQVDHLHADVIQVMDSEGADNLYKSAVTYLKMERAKEAGETFEKLRKKYPFDTRGWFGAMQAETNDFTTMRPDVQFYSNILDMYESYLSVLSQSGGNEWENVRKAEFYLDQLDAGVEKSLQLNSKAVKDLDEQYTETQKRLDDPYAKIAKLKKEKKTYATRLSVITGLITLFVWINGFIASLGEQEFFGPWVYDHTGAYWDFWRAILLIPDQVGTVVVGLIGGLVIIPIIAGLCVFVISKKWKKINSHITLVEKDAAELARIAQNKLRCVVSVGETEKHLPQLREKRQRLSRFVHTLGV